MFEGFANVWTPICMAKELRADRPLAVQVAGTPVVLFRSGDKPVAFVDRCPHRGVALSLGRVRDGCLECPFHGWQFNERGAVCHIPWNPDAKQDALRAIALPVREQAAQIWIYTNPDIPPAHEPILAESFMRPKLHVSGGAVLWNAHWTRAMENMLDWPHLPFVHARSIGKAMMTRRDARMDIHCEETPWGMHSIISIDGVDQPGSLDLHWPNRMVLSVPAPGRTLVMQVACIPVHENQTRMLLITGRDFLRFRLMDALFHYLNLRIAREDKAIVESSTPAEVPQAATELSVRTDWLPLYFRKRYFRELRGTALPAPSPRALPVV